jgi:hypothetical protein
LKIKNSDPGGGPPADSKRTSVYSDCCKFLVQVPPLPECNLPVYEQACAGAEDILIISIDEGTVRELEEALYI